MTHDQHQRLAAALAACATEKQNLQQQNEHLQDKVQQLDNLVATRQRRITELEAELVRRPTNAAFQALQSGLQQIEEEKRTVEQQLNAAKGKNHQLQQSLFQAEDALKIAQDERQQREREQDELIVLINRCLQMRCLTAEELPQWLRVVGPHDPHTI